MASCAWRWACWVMAATSGGGAGASSARGGSGARDEHRCYTLRELKHRGEHIMALPEGIEINPRVMLGKPVIRGTRIPVELVLRKLGEGATEHDLLDAYPNLKSEDIRAALT